MSSGKLDTSSDNTSQLILEKIKSRQAQDAETSYYLLLISNDMVYITSGKLHVSSRCYRILCAAVLTSISG